ncbi:MAG: response regulator [Chloroflexota bacterium]
MFINSIDTHERSRYGQQSKPRLGGGGSSPVLVVEDEVHIRWMVSVLLKQQGYIVTEATDGRAALTVLTDNPAFDLVITNIQMPGMNGIRLIAELGQFYPQIPLLVMSAYLEQPSVRSVDKRIAYLPKPFSRQQLLDAVTHSTMF